MTSTSEPDDMASGMHNRDEDSASGSTQADKRSDRHEGSQSALPEWAQRILTIVVIWALWALISTFLVQPFKIPSASMENTLPVGDRIIVNKMYDAKNAKRGDVIVFADDLKWEGQAPSGNPIVGAIRKVAEVTHISASGVHLVKRVVGLPGDKLSCTTDGKLKVNGVAVNEPYVKSGVSPCDSPVGISNWSITVPADHLWVMGDNRSNSADSRYHDMNSGGKLGSIPMSSVTGDVVAVAWPISSLGGSPNNESVFSKVPSAK